MARRSLSSAPSAARASPNAVTSYPYDVMMKVSAVRKSSSSSMIINGSLAGTLTAATPR